MYIRLKAGETLLIGELLNRRNERICQLNLPRSEMLSEDVKIQIKMLLNMGNISSEVLRGVQVTGAKQEWTEIKSILKEAGIPVIR